MVKVCVVQQRYTLHMILVHEESSPVALLMQYTIKEESVTLCQSDLMHECTYPRAGRCFCQVITA